MNAVAVDHAGEGRTTAHPDQALGRRVEDRLSRSGYLALGDVACEARDGVASLSGRLPSYYLKQVAQSVAAGVDGVRRVVNRIEVVGPAPRPPVGRDRAEAPTPFFPVN